MRNVLIIACMACTAILGSSMAWSSQAVFKATYKGKHSGFKVKSTRELKFNGGRSYTLETSANAMFASINEVSEFLLNEEALIIPLRYDYKRSVLGSKRQHSIEFDWSNLKANYVNKRSPEKNRSLELNAGMLDEPTFQLELQRKARTLKPSESVSFKYVKPVKIKNQLFYHYGTQNIDLKGKNFDTLFLSTEAPEGVKPSSDGKIIQVWLIPRYNYQIGKIKFIDEDDESYELVLTSYEYNNELMNKFR